VSAPATLLHLTTPAEWRTALRTGALAPPSLAEVGFVHLSTADQVAIPADRLFAGRRDLLLLAVDAATVGCEIRYEPGVHGGPAASMVGSTRSASGSTVGSARSASGPTVGSARSASGSTVGSARSASGSTVGSARSASGSTVGSARSASGMLFPHAYGPVPVSAVLAVSAYRPGADGTFAAPPDPPARADHPGRLREFADSLPRRVASAEEPVAGGVAVLQDDVPWAPALNRLLVDDGTPAQEIAAEADRVLGGAGRDHRCVTIRGTDPGPVARELGRSGWWVQHDVVMARPLDGSERAPGAEEVPLHAVRELWAGAWRPDLPADDPRRLRLPDRYRVEDRGTDLRVLAVREGEQVVAAAALYLDGATAVLEAVETAAPHRGRGYGNALLDGALAVAGRAGCDLLALHAQADGAPRDWYARHGFQVLDDAWSAGREP
jgi:uncharacterized protein (DUF952 family)/GNAT superfamily N-acetyltransferase